MTNKSAVDLSREWIDKEPSRSAIESLKAAFELAEQVLVEHDVGEPAEHDFDRLGNCRNCGEIIGWGGPTCSPSKSIRLTPQESEKLWREHEKVDVNTGYTLISPCYFVELIMDAMDAKQP